VLSENFKSLPKSGNWVSQLLPLPHCCILKKDAEKLLQQRQKQQE